jgi:hypothetical protein
MGSMQRWAAAAGLVAVMAAAPAQAKEVDVKVKDLQEVRLTRNGAAFVTFNAAAGATPTLAVSGLTAKSLKYRDSTGAKAVTVAPGAVDFGAGSEFGVTKLYSEGVGTAISAFTSVVYILGTVSETSLTPAGASSIPWRAIL